MSLALLSGPSRVWSDTSERFSCQAITQLPGMLHKDHPHPEVHLTIAHTGMGGRTDAGLLLPRTAQRAGRPSGRPQCAHPSGRHAQRPTVVADALLRCPALTHVRLLTLTHCCPVCIHADRSAPSIVIALCRTARPSQFRWPFSQPSSSNWTQATLAHSRAACSTCPAIASRTAASSACSAAWPSSCHRRPATAPRLVASRRRSFVKRVARLLHSFFAVIGHVTRFEQ